MFLVPSGLGTRLLLAEETNASMWQGPECQMCNGTGIARMRPGNGTFVYVRCPACNGHGKEPS